MPRYLIAWVSSAAIMLSVAATAADPGRVSVRVGALGDSITDEWSNLDPSGAQFGYKTTGVRSWVEFGVLSGRLDFGPYTRYDSPSGNEEVRRAGADRSSFAWNFARGGASTEANGLDALNRFFTRGFTQTPGGAETETNLPKNFHRAARSRIVDYGVVIIGGNDFLHGILAAGHFKDRPADDPANIKRLDAMRDALAGALRRVTDDGALPIRMVLGDLFDIGDAMATAGTPFTSEQRAMIRGNVRAWNKRVVDLAAHLFPGRPMPVVSLWEWWEQATSPDFRVHGVRVRAHAAPRPEGQGVEPPLHLWNTLTLPDGVHPAPIGAALIAARFIDAINSADHRGMKPLTPKELVTLTGLDPQKPPTARAGGPYTIRIGRDLPLDASTSTDPNPGDVPLLKYHWDLDDDDRFDDAFGARLTVPWSDLARLGIREGVHPIRVRVDDTFGGVRTSAPTELSVTP